MHYKISLIITTFWFFSAMQIYPLDLNKIKNGEEKPVYQKYYSIGPEIPVTGATGYYDYQSNGDCRRYIHRFSPQQLLSVYMTSSDSLNISNSRKVTYSLSTNDGLSWTFISDIPPGNRSGFPSLTTTGIGSAVIYQNSTLETNIAKETFPLSGIFGYFSSPIPLIGAACSRLSNGKILISGKIFYDTVFAEVFDPVTNTFSNTTYISNYTSLRTTHATGPAGKALIIIYDFGYSYSRILISFTEDNGISWSPVQTLIQSSILNGEYANIFFGIDAVYDNSGNYYVAFNTTDSLGTFSSAKLWVQKNNNSPKLVAQHNGINSIPEAANTVLHADAGLCTIDHPSLSVSDDDSLLFISYSVLFQNDTLNGFHKSHIYLSSCRTSEMIFNQPVKITQSGPGSFDERYSSLNRVTPFLGNGLNRTIYMVYQKDRQPGSCAFNDGAPISRSSLIFRKIYDVANPIGVINNSEVNSNQYSLSQNYPNPFNPQTNINFYLPVNSHITISLFDINGKLLEILVNRDLQRGNHSLEINMNKYSSGIYFYILQSESFLQAKKMIFLK